MHRLVIALLLIGFGVSAGAASANPVMPPDTPRARHVTVALADGTALSGTLLDLSPAAVRLLVNGSGREYRLEDVASIESRGDPVTNGALIGAALVGGLCLIVGGQGLDDPGDLMGVVIVNAGLGAAIGAGIDALHSDRTVLYDRTRGPHGSGHGMRPTLSFRVRF